MIRQAYADGEWFTSKGFEVIRHKIECISSAQGNLNGSILGIKRMQVYPTLVTHGKRFQNDILNFIFEFAHQTLTKRKSSRIQRSLHFKPRIQFQVNELKRLANEYTQKYQVPVPLSYNKSAVLHQRYLNLRFSHCSSDRACAIAESLKEAIEASRL